MNVDDIRLAVGYRGGRVDQNIIGKDELAFLFSEIDRLEVALAQTEELWRERGEQLKRLSYGGIMPKDGDMLIYLSEGVDHALSHIPPKALERAVDPVDIIKQHAALLYEKIQRLRAARD